MLMQDHLIAIIHPPCGRIPLPLDPTLRLRAEPHLRFAGQITGCEGYVESAAIGLLAGRFAAAERQREMILAPPPTTAHGALLAHITGGHLEVDDDATERSRSYQPMNINFGLLPPLTSAIKSTSGQRVRGTEKTLARKRALAARALADLDRWIGGAFHVAAAE